MQRIVRGICIIGKTKSTFWENEKYIFKNFSCCNFISVLSAVYISIFCLKAI